MTFRRTLQAWLCVALALWPSFAVTGPNTCPSGPASRGAHCIHRGGNTYLSSYCSTVLRISTPTTTITATATATETSDMITTTGLQTVTEPPITKYSTKTIMVNSTSTFSETSTYITATFTSFSATTTTTSTSITYVYTCPTTGKASSSSSAFASSSSTTTVPISSSSSFSRVNLGTGLPSTILPLPPYSYSNYSTSRLPTVTRGSSSSAEPSFVGLYNRQIEDEQQRPCLRHFVRKYGRNGVSSACRCFGLPTPSTSVTATSTSSITITSTRTVAVEGTTSYIPKTTQTSLKTTTKHFSTTTTFTTSVAETVYTTFTRTIVETSTSFTSLPTPSSFNIFYVDSSANSSSPAANFFQAVAAPGGSGIMLAPEAAADNFALDTLGRLVDSTADNQFIVKNTKDLFPFEFLDTGADTEDIPICSACNGMLTCNYPDSIGNTFAICFGYLALGQPNVFRHDADGDGQPDCRSIALQYK